MNSLWNRLLNADKSRDVMVSISTSEEGDVEDIYAHGGSSNGTGDIEGLGLVKSHAYAVLEFKEVDGQRFVLVLNPWGRSCWTGDYSIEDNQNWTPSLKKALGYDMLAIEDKGLFWIEFETMTKVFELIEMNWNPSMMSYSITRF